MRFVVLTAMLGLAFLAAPCFADEAPDTRSYWVCEGGWFAKAKDGSWYELNEFTYRKLGKPSKFREVKRTKEYVELADDFRKVRIKLSDTSSEVKHGDDPWKTLYKGRWKAPMVDE